MIEEWRDVVGYEGVYSVSNLGRVRRDRSFAATSGHICKASENTRYADVHLSVDGKSKRILVHKLVAEAFLGPRPPGLTINHKDGNKRNNTPENLEYVTQRENSQHAARMGLAPRGERNGMVKHPESRMTGEKHWTRHKIERAARGERQGSASTTEAEVLAIRKRFADGESRNVIAKSLKRDFKFVSRIVRRETWKHI